MYIYSYFCRRLAWGGACLLLRRLVAAICVACFDFVEANIFKNHSFIHQNIYIYSYIFFVFRRLDCGAACVCGCADWCSLLRLPRGKYKFIVLYM